MLVVSDSATLTIAPAFQGQGRLFRSAGRLAIPWPCMLVTSGTAGFTNNTIAQGRRRLPSTWFVIYGARPVVSGDTARCKGLTSEGSCVSSDTA